MNGLMDELLVHWRHYAEDSSANVGRLLCGVVCVGLVSGAQLRAEMDVRMVYQAMMGWTVAFLGGRDMIRKGKWQVEVLPRYICTIWYFTRRPHSNAERRYEHVCDVIKI
jgi:hypothetical protein